MSETVVREGLVTAVQADVAVVTVGRPDACGHCAVGHACSNLGGGRKHVARARNLCGASPGQRVRLEMEAGALIGAAFFVYFLPSLGILLFAWAGHHLGPSWGMSPDGGAMIGAVLALGAAVTVALVHRHRTRECPPVFAAVEILPGPADVSCPHTENP